MDPKPWQRLKNLVADAMELGLEERFRFLRERCADDDDLRSAAESLLQAYDTAHSFLESSEPTRPTERSTVALEDLPARLEPGEQLGPYVIRELIGEGAFGEVYVADRTSPVRMRVALKIIKPGMDSRRVLQRFESERQALALMSHSGIARVHDAGATEQGRPYFAMEYVPGVSITEHCDRNRLGINERIRLFVKVCDAVQHAHQKGIIHRDLKPSNILVAYEGDETVVKIIDFGVAKALNQQLTQASMYTEHGQFIGTPAYMSPEQAEVTAQDIDTRSDVYSLGVLLYQLLTGMLPFDLHRAGLQELRRLIREVDPPRPSTKLTTEERAAPEVSQESARNRRLNLHTLTRRVRGDLDWITMRCLEKDRGRRYSGADRLAQDLRRHLRNEPVDAGPPGMAYRARKFVRRHRGAVVSAVLIGAVVLAGVVAVTVSEVNRRIAVRENARYEATELLEEARSLFFGLFFESQRQGVMSRGLYAGDLEATLREALAKDPDLLEARLLIVHRLVLSGERDAAVEEAREVVARHPASAKARAALAGLEGDPADAEPPEGDLRRDHWFYYRALATADHDEAIALLEKSLEANDWYFDAKWQLAVRRFAIEDDERLLEDAELLTRVEPDRALVWYLKALALASQDRFDEATEAYTHSIALDERVWRAYYGRAWARHNKGEYTEALDDLRLAAERAPDRAEVCALKGAALAQLEDWQGSISAYDQAERSGAVDWWIFYDRADAYRNLRHLEESLADLNEALERVPSELTGRVAWTLEMRGDVLRDLRQMKRARDDFIASIEADPDYPPAHFNLGRLHLLEGRYGEALRSFGEAVRCQPGVGWEIGRGMAHWFAGNANSAIRDLAPLTRWPDYLWVHLWLWDIQTSLGDADAARAALDSAEIADPGKNPLFSRIIAHLRGETGEDDVLTVTESDNDRLYAYYFLGSHARSQGRPQNAIDWYRKALELGLTGELEHDLAECQLRSLER